MIKVPDFKLINKLLPKYSGFLPLNLMDLGLNPALFNQFKKSYSNLYIDEYLDVFPPTRFRRFAKYDVDVSKETYFNLTFNPNCSLIQNVDDFRKNERIYNNIEKVFVYDKCITDFITNISGLICHIHPTKINHMSINFHQVRQICYPKQNSDNSPEGIHRDGADYIVSARVLNRVNVKEGHSTIYDETKENVLFETTLNNNELLFQEDRKLWHYVTPIECLEPTNLGFRNIIGLDIIIDK